MSEKKMWPTPVAQDYKRRGPNSKQQGLADSVRMWPTPVASDRKGGVSDDAWNAYTADKRKGRLSLLKNAVLFPTPGTKGLSNGSGNVQKANEPYEAGAISDEERRSFRAGNGGQLNPDWVEWLMGWPISWTSLRPMSKEDYEEWEEKAMKGTLWTVDPADISSTDEGYIPRVTLEKAFRQQRLKALGNGQVPSCACLAEAVLQECV